MNEKGCIGTEWVHKFCHKRLVAFFSNDQMIKDGLEAFHIPFHVAKVVHSIIVIWSLKFDNLIPVIAA